MRVGLISCSKTKLPHPAPARDFYTGQLFKLAMRWMERTYTEIDEWCVLSAKHSVLLPDEVVEPYDLALTDMSADERKEWASKTRDVIINRWGTDTIYTVLAGQHYRAALHGLPLVEDLIGNWTKLRKYSGMSKPAMGIGVIKQRLIKELKTSDCDRETFAPEDGQQDLMKLLDDYKAPE